MQRWTSSFFERVPLAELGVKLCLGHLGSPCPVGQDVSKFILMHVNGMHTVTVRFCACLHAAEKRIQLVRARLFPATVKNPHSAFTFEVLDLFNMLTMESKTAAYDFSNAMRRLTENVLLSQEKVWMFVPSLSLSHRLFRVEPNNSHTLSGSSGT